jgi:peptide deformylase
MEMMKRNAIITLPNPHLRQKSARVHVITPEVSQLITDMQTATLDWEDHRPHELGVALAAIQVDRLTRIVIIRNNFDNKNDRSFVTLINPEVVKLEGPIVYDHEGCLSVPDVYGLVPRHNRARVKALDEDGREIRLKADGFLARVLQHEIDHTNGVVFIDHIKDQDAFFNLTEDGKLVKVSHDSILNNRLLW